MPIFDYQCKKCGTAVNDELVQSSDAIINCAICGEIMEKLPCACNFSVIPGAISKFKTKVGKKVPTEYKTTGGCNFGKPE